MAQHPVMLWVSCYRRLWVLGYMMAPGDGAGSWKRDTLRHINTILHLAWEILLSVPVGHSVGSGTFGVCADQRCQHAT